MNTNQQLVARNNEYILYVTGSAEGYTWQVVNLAGDVMAQSVAVPLYRHASTARQLGRRAFAKVVAAHG